MLEVIRTAVLAGLGAGVITKEKAEEITNRLVEQGKLTADEGKQLVNDILKSGGERWDDVQANLRDILRNTLSSADVARAHDLEAVTLRQEKLEQRVEMLENALEQIRSSHGQASSDG